MPKPYPKKVMVLCLDVAQIPSSIICRWKVHDLILRAVLPNLELGSLSTGVAGPKWLGFLVLIKTPSYDL